MAKYTVYVIKWFSRCLLVGFVALALALAMFSIQNYNSTFVYYQEASFYNISDKSGFYQKSFTKTSTSETFPTYSTQEERRKDTTTKATNEAGDVNSNFNPYHLETCTKPKQQVAFLKVHKAGSTTVMNIFLRYGDSHNLNIVLPKTKNQSTFNYLGYGMTIQDKRINKIPDNETYSIICNHAVYNHDVFKRLIGPDSVNIGIVRDPFTHFPSAAYYYGLLKRLQNQLGKSYSASRLLAFYLKHPNMFGGTAWHLHNGMFSDFGLPIRYYDNDTVINQYLSRIENEFALIMVTEMFEESLILLKRILCWEIKDILYVKLNINTKKEKNPITLSKESKKDLFRYNYADFKLYIYSKERLLKQIENQSPDFNDEVKHFKAVNSLVSKFCYSTKKKDFNKNSVKKIDSSKWNKEFVISAEECAFMMSPELSLLQKLMTKAEKKFNNWLKFKLKTTTDSFSKLTELRNVVAK